MKRISSGYPADPVLVVFAVALILIGSSAAVATDLDENGVEDSDEQALADRFCPTLVLHRADQDVSPEPVEIVTDQLFRLYRASATGEYNGDGFVPWTDVPPSGDYTEIDGWMWGGPHTREALYCDPQPAGTSWELYHFDYAGPGPVCVDVSNAHYDQPGGWYDAYHNGRTWQHPDQPINVYYPPGSEFPTTTYAHIFQHPNGTQWVIQYWFFYPFNDWINNHEGDWEHINVIVSSNNPTSAVVNSVVYFFHEKFKECDPVQSENPNGVFECYIVDGTHPVVFVGGHGDADGGAGEGSHASYPVWGKWEHVVLGSFGGIQFVDFDETVGGDGLYIPWFTIVDGDGSDRDGVVVVKNTNQYNYETTPTMSWLKANVAWGHVHVASIGQHQALANFFNQGGGYDAPLGPAHQPTWNNVDWDSQHEYVYLATDFPHASQANWSPPPTTTVTIPGQNSTVSGLLTIEGTVHYADEVVLEWGAGANPADWQETGMEVNQFPVVQAPIGTWNTGVVPAGTYSIRIRSYYGGQPTDIVRTVSVTHRNISVAPTGGDFESIQGGIDFAATGDTVRVASGQYNGSLTVDPSVYLYLTTYHPALPAIVVGSAGKPAITIENHDYPCVIDGFVFRHNYIPGVPGSASDSEPGAKIEDASPIFRNCVFIRNSADYGGAVRIMAGARPIFEDCQFEENRAGVEGGGLSITSSAIQASVECHRCSFVGNTVDANNAGAAVSLKTNLYGLNPSIFSECRFDDNGEIGPFDNATVYLRTSGAVQFIGCTFSRNRTVDVVRMDATSPVFDLCTIAGNTGLDGFLGWLVSPAAVTVTRSIIASNGGPFAVGNPSLTSLIGLQNSIVYANDDQGRGPTDTAWAAAGQNNYRIDPAFCNAANGYYDLYAFSPASAPAPPNPGYFGERVGAYDVGCVPSAIVTAAANDTIPGRPDLVIACPKGDLKSLVVKVNLNGPITRNIDWREITLDVADCAPGVRVYDQSGFVEAQSDAAGPDYEAEISHSYFAGSGVNDVDVLLNGHPLASRAHFEIRSPDISGDGVVDLVDFAAFGPAYTSPPKPYNSLCDLGAPLGTITLPDFSVLGAHWGHEKLSGHQTISDEPPTSEAGVSLQFTEEFPTANTHRLYVDVGVENFADVTTSVFSMQTGSNRLSFVNWIPATQTVGEVLFTPVIRDGAEELFYGVFVSESFTGSGATIGRLVFDVSGAEPMGIMEDNFVLTVGDVLSDSPESGIVVATMGGVFSRTLDPAVALIYHNSLEQNFPNPFNPTTTLAFSIKNGENVNLTIYDVAGRRVRELVHEHRDRGAYKIVWDGQNDAGQTVASGVYFYKFVAGSFTETKKMTILK